jgi:hypothetical protein
MPNISLNETEHVSLCEALDRILNKGAVVVGEVTISVANVDLIYLGLQVILTSIETVRQTLTLTSSAYYSPSSNVGLDEEARANEFFGSP